MGASISSDCYERPIWWSVAPRPSTCSGSRDSRPAGRLWATTDWVVFITRGVHNKRWPDCIRRLGCLRIVDRVQRILSIKAGCTEKQWPDPSGRADSHGTDRTICLLDGQHKEPSWLGWPLQHVRAPPYTHADSQLSDPEPDGHKQINKEMSLTGPAAVRSTTSRNRRRKKKEKIFICIPDRIEMQDWHDIWNNRRDKHRFPEAGFVSARHLFSLT